MPWLLQVLIALVLVGLLLWIVEQIPMDATIARIIRVIVIVVVCLWLLQLIVTVFGGYTLLPAPRGRP